MNGSQSNQNDCMVFTDSALDFDSVSIYVGYSQ
jgi:hypothetical protein